jgi:hypothetical protein
MTRHVFTPQERRQGGLRHTHRFTTGERTKGGKARAAQAALERIAAPTAAELAVRTAALVLDPNARFEYPVETQPGLVQYIDILCTIDGQATAIEVDGSHGWHMNGKMANYDEIKARWCHANGVHSVTVSSTMAGRPVEQIVAYLLIGPYLRLSQPVTTIPF